MIDASAAYLMASRAVGDALLREADAVVAPDLLIPELFNTRWKLLRAGRRAISARVLLAFTDRIRLVRSIEYAVEADALARAIDHPVYGCFYAAAATRHAATLVTADARFASKVPGVPTAIIATP